MTFSSCAPFVLLPTYLDSNVKHDLGSGEYAKRRAECEAAVKVLQRKYPAIKALRDATLEQVQSVESEMDEIVFYRARHVVTEDDRTQK